MEQNRLAIRDADLVESIQRGQAEAEAVLYEKYAARVYYLALKHLRSAEDAEDVRAETFLRVLQSIRRNQLREARALASFILGTAHNIILESSRRRQRAEQIAQGAGERAEAEESGSLYLTAETKRAIEQVIERLKPREQEFLRMYYYEELSGDEIARRLDIKEERVRLVKSRALNSFRQIYQRLIKRD